MNNTLQLPFKYLTKVILPTMNLGLVTYLTGKWKMRDLDIRHQQNSNGPWVKDQAHSSTEKT